MVEIADTSEVSRATLYNHFRDKGSVLRAVLESEIERVFLIIDSDLTPKDALKAIAQEISSDQALEMMRKTDAGALGQLLVRQEDPLWQQVDSGLRKLLRDEKAATIAHLWLLGQVLQPLSARQIHEQSEAIVSLSSPETSHLHHF